MGELAPALSARRASAVPGGGRRGGSRPPTLPLVLLLPPSPRPALAERSSRREGGDQGYFMQGASPLASPGAAPARHRFALPLWKTQWELASALPARQASAIPGGGACLLCRLPALPLRCPRGACRFRSPVNPAFSLLFRPYPPSPLPGGKGVTIGYFMQGAAPLASPGLNPGGTGAGGEPRTRRGCAFGIANSPQNR